MRLIRCMMIIVIMINFYFLIATVDPSLREFVGKIEKVNLIS